MCVSENGFVHVNAGADKGKKIFFKNLKKEEGGLPSGSPGAGVTGGCDLRVMGARN